MAPKQAKKPAWVDCERCKCTILAIDKNAHLELNCKKDQVKCPYVENRILYTWLERSLGLPDGVPKDAVIMHPTAAALIGAAIMHPVMLSRKGAPTMVKRVWLSKSSAPAAIILPGAELSNAWSEDFKTVTVTNLTEEIPVATQINIKINNYKVDADNCDILKYCFNNYYVSIGSILVYYYFGKKLEIEVTDLKSESKDAEEWYLLSEKTAWIMQKETVLYPKKMQSLGGYDNILEEIKTYINIVFKAGPMSANFQPTRGLLLYGHSGIGKTAICKYIIDSLNCFHVELSSSVILTKYFGETENTITTLFEKAVQNQPSIIFVDQIDTICPTKPTSKSTERERRVTSAFVAALDGLHEADCKVFVLATTCNPENVHTKLWRFGRLDKEIEVPIPDRMRRREILYSQLKNLPNKVSDQLDSIADMAHGYVAADLMNLCSQATMNCIKRSSEYIEHEDLMTALTVVRPSAMRELLIEVPNVRWADIGGQSDLKMKLRQAVEWPLKHAESFRRLGVKPPSGVLLYGPPGCSKTMIAKAVATESGLNFLSIKGPELFSRWIGDSERAVRDLFTKARQVAPSIIFFDEMDAIGTQRAGSNCDSGVHQRVLAQLLTELDGIVPLNSVTILAATNRPDMMDRALLRPGRLDRLIYVPLPDYETRLQIIELKLSTMTTNDVNTASLAARTEGFSGAELEALCKEAALKALEVDLDCPHVTMEHFELVIKDYKPRTPQHLLEIYEEFALGQRA